MNPRQYVQFLDTIEKLKCHTRHSWTSTGRRESVAEHSWRLSVMALLCADEYPELDMIKVLKMCLIHDMGEAFTGDIPAFDKHQGHEEREAMLLNNWVTSLPEPYRSEFQALYAEMDARQTLEARIYKAIDNMEAVIQHNLSDISTWIPLEYELNLTYGNDKVGFSQYFTELREEIRKDTQTKINSAKE